jgi:hypothetical protein
MKDNHLRIAKELIEVRYGVKVTSIDFEDGSGSKFIITTTSKPFKKQFIVL